MLVIRCILLFFVIKTVTNLICNRFLMIKKSRLVLSFETYCFNLRIDFISKKRNYK